MPDSVNLGVAIGLEPAEAIEYFRQKGYAISWNWQETLQEANARAFTVAKMADLDLLKTVRSALDEALAQGRSERWFVSTLTPVLQQAGWWGQRLAVGAEGQAQRIQLGSPERLRLIFRQNLQTAYNAGRWEEMLLNRESRPFWQYVAVMDAVTRPSHAALNGQVYRWDDPFWSSHYPPNGWNCRCRVRALSERALKRRGFEVSASEGRITTRTEDAGRDYRTGEVTRVQVKGVRTTGRDGKPTTVWTDPGFSYNAGAARFQPELDRYPEDIARAYVEGVVSGPEFGRWMRIWTRVIEGLTAGATGDAARRRVAREFVREPSRIRQALDAQGLQDIPTPPSMTYPVAVLAAPERKALDTRSQTVKLSTASLLEHLAAHPEITAADYARLNRMLVEGEIYADGDKKVVLLSGEGGVYRAVIKHVAEPDENFLLTLFKSTEEQATNQVRRRYARIR
jgi:SPP1 gp7 family putative phage head morphogenesis protein